MVFTLNVTFEDTEGKALKDKKDNRSWHDAILEEFGVETND